MFRRPSDPPDPLPPLRASDEVVRLHTEWARVHAASDEGHALAGLRSRARVVASMAGGADHRLLGDLIRAIDAIAARVDELSERVDNLATTTDDLARSLSEEVSALRGTVQRMSTDGREDFPRPNR
jgi:ABC-type transporter Mla subunit MlaD